MARVFWVAKAGTAHLLGVIYYLSSNNLLLDKDEADEEAIKKEQDLLASGQGEGDLQPTGRVVGIIRRKWRQYCGIIKKNEITEVSDPET